MSLEILINTTLQETRVALMEQGLLQEVYVERASRRGSVGNIYVGKVVRVMPGMEAAFVDIGLERAAFIHAADIVATDTRGLEVNTAEEKSIAQLVHEGQQLIVQVVKDPIGDKGARLTTRISLVSRHLVCMPGNLHLGISARIDNEGERTRLLELLEDSLQQEGQDNSSGYIIRTAAEGAAEQEIRSDIRFLARVWEAVQRRIKRADGIGPVYRELVLYLRAMRDMLSQEVRAIRIDDEDTCMEVRQFLEEFVPEIQVTVEHYDGERPLFELHNVDDEIHKALARKVKLKSGGNLVIDQNEAMTTIDVNTGSFLGRKNQEETILKTNLEAAKAIARQLRVRNLGGIIILDFIDMHSEDHQRLVLRTLHKALEKDRIKTRVGEFSGLGLVEMTRKRNRESLEQVLCEECSVCKGKGKIKTAEAVCYEIFREILRVSRAFENDSLLVMASQQVVDRLIDEDSAVVADLGEVCGKRIKFQVEQFYNNEQFDVVFS